MLSVEPTKNAFIFVQTLLIEQAQRGSVPFATKSEYENTKENENEFFMTYYSERWCELYSV